MNLVFQDKKYCILMVRVEEFLRKYRTTRPVVRQSSGFWIEALPSFYELLSALIGLREDAGMLDAV